MDNGFNPAYVELPLSAEDAFWHASAGVEYAPVRVPLRVDPHTISNRWYHLPTDTWGSSGRYVYNLSALKRYYASE